MLPPHSSPLSPQDPRAPRSASELVPPLFRPKLHPCESVSNYALRVDADLTSRNRELVNTTSRLAESRFVVRMLYKDIH